MMRYTTLGIAAILGAIIPLRQLATIPAMGQEQTRSKVAGFPTGRTLWRAYYPRLGRTRSFRSSRSRPPSNRNESIAITWLRLEATRWCWPTCKGQAASGTSGSWTPMARCSGRSFPLKSSSTCGHTASERTSESVLRCHERSGVYGEQLLLAVFQNFDTRKLSNSPHDRSNPGFNTFLPIPFSKSCRITLHNPPNRHGVGMVDWHKYEKGAPLTPLRLHADYRLYDPSKPRGNYAELANLEGAGFIHGVQIGYDQKDFGDCLFHTAGCRFSLTARLIPMPSAGTTPKTISESPGDSIRCNPPGSVAPGTKCAMALTTRSAPTIGSSPPIRLPSDLRFRSAPAPEATRWRPSSTAIGFPAPTPPRQICLPNGK